MNLGQTPTVSAVPAGRHGYAFPNTLHDVARFGYVQDEVVIAGTARSYTPVSPLASIADGRWDSRRSTAARWQSAVKTSPSEGAVEAKARQRAN